MLTTINTAMKKFPAIYKLFNSRWHPTEKSNEFLTTFSITAWAKLSPQHRACTTQHHTLSLAFPCKRVTKKKPAIFFSESELSTPKRFGHKALQELNGITQEKFGLTAQQETPKSQLCKKPTSNERKTERRRLEKEIKDDIQMNVVLRQ